MPSFYTLAPDTTIEVSGSHVFTVDHNQILLDADLQDNGHLITVLHLSGGSMNGDLSGTNAYFNYLIGDGSRIINIPPTSTKKVVVYIGDNLSKTYTIGHNLHTEDIVSSVYNAATKSQVYVDTTIIDIDTIQLQFSNAPATSAYKVVIYS